MVTAPIDVETRGDVQELARLARAQTPADLARRIEQPGYVSEGRRRLWDSFARPSGLEADDGHDVTASAGEVLGRLLFLEADFEHEPSRAREQALRWCADALIDPNDAPDLWDSLRAIVAEARPAGGMLTRPVLAAKLRRRYRLRDYPAHERDWALLREISRANVEQVVDTLGGRLHIGRNDAVAAIHDAAAQHRFVALVGPSGCGKTALAKAWAAGADDAEVLWLQPNDIAALGTPGAGLQHPLIDLLRGAAQRIHVVVDGLDRVFSAGADGALASLLIAAAAETAFPASILLTSQVQEWAHIADRLAVHNALVRWEPVPVVGFTDTELTAVLSEFPALRDVALRGRLTGAFRQPKVLDVVLRRLLTPRLGQTEPPAAQESAFAEWFYESIVRGSGRARTSRAALVMRLAEVQGDRQQSDIALTDLNPADLEHIDDLERDGVCAQRDGRVGFAHDLYGDWMREQVLRSHDDDRAVYVGARLASPLWHRAIRLHALSLLEGVETATEWRREMERLGGQAPGLLHDLFLEAPLFSAEPRKMLEGVWPVLVEDDGRLLRRLLVRFLHTATVPHPAVLEQLRSYAPDLETQAAATYRLPYWPLWLPLLRALSDHAEDALAPAGDSVARVVDLWLRWTPDDWPCRGEAADLAVRRGRTLVSELASGRYLNDDIEGHAWSAVLAAIRERAADVRDIAFQLAGHAPDGSGANDDAGEESGARDAPRRRGPRVNEGFRGVCLDTDALHPVIAADPELAGELLTAILVRRPRLSSPMGIPLPGDGLGVGDLLKWSSPLYSRGPFLPYLKSAPGEARAFVVSLVEEATDAWAEARGTEVGAVPQITVPLEDGRAQTYRGDDQVMGWYRGDVRAPNMLVSLLMALEKWLYDEADAGRDIEPVVRELLEATTSVAMIGVLIAVGCRHPRLLAGPLRPLLAVHELYLWDDRIKRQERDFLPIIGLPLESEPYQRMAFEWHRMEHRQRSLETVAQGLLISDDAIAAYLTDVTARWRERIDADGEPAALRFLSARLDRAHWKRSTRANSEEVWEFEAPAELLAESERTSQEINERLFWLTMPGECRRALDSSEQLSDEQLDGLWDVAKDRASTVPPEDVTADGIIARDDTACGIAALFLVRHRDWLRKYPERETWCRDTLLSAATAPRQRQWFEGGRVGTESSWDSFCAEALPVVWAEHPRDRDLRDAIARLSLRPSYDTVSRLFGAAGEHRDVLGDDFRRLQHLAVHVALFRRAWDVASGRGDQQAAEAAFEKLKPALIAFGDGTLDPGVPDWVPLAAPPSGVRRRWSEIDTQYLQVAYAWMPPFDAARDGEERAAWVAHWQQSVKELTSRLQRTVDPRDGRVRDTPYPNDRDLLRRLPRRFVEMEPDEAAPLWRSILALSDVAHYWVEDFARAWCREGLRNGPAEARFVATWEAILDWTAAREGDRAYRGTRVEPLLLGLDGLMLDLWSAEQAATVARLTPRFRRWAQRHLGIRDSAAVFARFLCRDAAAPILERGVVWLAAAETRPATWDGDTGYEDTVGKLLGRVMRVHPEIARRPTDTGAAFRALLQRLADRQVPVALELVSRLSSRIQPTGNQD